MRWNGVGEARLEPLADAEYFTEDDTRVRRTASGRIIPPPEEDAADRAMAECIMALLCLNAEETLAA
jgi:hypothetical protein